MEPANISGDTCYVPGITNVLFYKDCLVDPGNCENIDWDNPPRVRLAAITHLHSDHFWNGAKLHSAGTKIYASRSERSAIENTDVNTNGSFCLAVPPQSMLSWFFKKVCCPVDGIIEELQWPLEAIPLPGHTQWQFGFMTPDGVLAAADALIAKKVWDTKKIVFYTSPADARRSLIHILDSGADYIMPAHGDLLNKDQAADLVAVNLRGIDMLEDLVLESLGKDERTTEEMVSSVACTLKMRDDFTMHSIAETTVRAFLHMLNEENRVRYELRGHKVYWQAER